MVFLSARIPSGQAQQRGGQPRERAGNPRKHMQPPDQTRHKPGHARGEPSSVLAIGNNPDESRLTRVPSRRWDRSPSLPPLIQSAARCLLGGKEDACFFQELVFHHQASIIRSQAHDLGMSLCRGWCPGNVGLASFTLMLGMSLCRGWCPGNVGLASFTLMLDPPAQQRLPNLKITSNTRDPHLLINHKRRSITSTLRRIRLPRALPTHLLLNTLPRPDNPV